MFDVKQRNHQPRWATYRDWSLQHGSDIIYVSVFGEPMVILNSLQATNELLEKRSSNYSDRPQHASDVHGKRSHERGLGPRPYEILRQLKTASKDLSSVFRPERFVKEEGKELPPPHPERFAFGFGRRVCPGKSLADNSAWILIAYLLSTFDMKKALDQDGQEVDPEVEYNDGLVSHPSYFRCRFIPRPEKASELISAK
ncbi:hypothetical protein VNI00_013293 [Paramarasmius palmivorus]|uniref:Cytochrome P450 n=1 Tax=Paramarasmius palmivorus TaxID=297713 RepID=A0AAW0C019_9AGAR